MFPSFLRRVQRLEQPVRDEAKCQVAIDARARVGRKVDKLIAMTRREEPLDSFGSPVPDAPAGPSPARDRLMARLDKIHDSHRRDFDPDAET